MADIANRRDSYRFEDETETEQEEEVELISSIRSNPTNNNNLLDGWCQAYLDRLRQQPLQTKAITCSVVSAFGAILGNFYATADPRLKHKKPETTFQQKSIEVIAFALYGGMVGGPLTHYWNQWLEENCNCNLEDKKKNKSWNMLVDQLIAQPPMLFLMHLLLDMTGAALRELPRSWNRSLARTGPSVVLSWRFWPVVIYLTLYLAKKKRHAAIAMNVAGIYWMSKIANLRSREQPITHAIRA